MMKKRFVRSLLWATACGSGIATIAGVLVALRLADVGAITLPAPLADLPRWMLSLLAVALVVTAGGAVASAIILHRFARGPKRPTTREAPAGEPQPWWLEPAPTAP